MSRRTSHEDWIAEAKERFGDDLLNWAFVCPSCRRVTTIREWKDAGAPEGAVAFSCVGRYLERSAEMCEEPGPCSYAGGGLFRLNPVVVEFDDGSLRECFEFADAPTPAEAERATP